MNLINNSVVFFSQTETVYCEKKTNIKEKTILHLYASKAQDREQLCEMETIAKKTPNPSFFPSLSSHVE